MTQTPEPWQRRYVDANGIRFHYVEAGRGPLVLLLHGFPEYWYSWRHQIPALATRFRVVAPDLRGYNRSDKPKTGYDVGTLADDAASIVEALGERRCLLAGHDWGGAIAWTVAARRPEVVERLVILNCPHPAAMSRALRSSPAQLLRSWYMFFFQIPKLPEWLLRRNDFATIAQVIRRQMVHPERLTDADLDRYRGAMARPDALESALEYYRVNFRLAVRSGGSHVGPVEAPTLVIWGEQDVALGKELLVGLDRWAPNARVELIPTSSHWVQQDEPEIVTRLMLEFL
jgi:pimeloyl-ACP methyl ester carboxylesterase